LRAEFVKKLGKESAIAVDDLGFVSESLGRSRAGREMWEKLPPRVPLEEHASGRVTSPNHPTKRKS